MNRIYSKRMNGLKASEIREILKITEKPDVISFAGGLPAPELFPVEAMKAMSALVLDECGREALQYAATEGYPPLREWIAARMNATLGTAFDRDNILITHGSQQALDLSGKVFIDEGDGVVCESPTYLAAISAFKAYGATFVEAPTDAGGMRAEDLDAVLDANPHVKLIYVIPNFQNPTGTTLNRTRRKLLAQLAATRGVQIIEDNPYGELRFEGGHLPSIQSFDTEGNVLCTGTFSKILCPGVRIGWIAGDKEIIRKYVLVKQGTDLQCNTLAQIMIARFLEHYDIDAHIASIVELYRKRRDVALAAMERDFPEGVRFTHPEGGLFVWATLPSQVNAADLLTRCLEKKVAFVPGGSFFPGGGNENTLRINFSNMDEQRINHGIGILAETLRETMDACV